MAKTKQQVDYSAMSRAQLEQRLRLAEDVALMYSWSPVGHDRSDREKAAFMLWRRWFDFVGDDALPLRNLHLNDDAVASLARQRDEERQRIDGALQRLVVVEPVVS